MDQKSKAQFESGPRNIARRRSESILDLGFAILGPLGPNPSNLDVDGYDLRRVSNVIGSKRVPLPSLCFSMMEPLNR